jgi:hypothetical protein
MICSAKEHRMIYQYEIDSGICLTCTCNRIGINDFREYIIKYVGNAKCQDYHCSVTMGCGWIGSHHGGARMTCGKCSGNSFHPGLSDYGFKLFNYISNQNARITVNERQALLASEEQKRKKEAKERQEQEENTRKYTPKPQEYYRIESENKHKKEQQNLDNHNKHIKDLINLIDKINKSKQQIMTDIKKHNKGYIIRNCQINSKYNSRIYCSDIVYTTIPKLKSKYCCFTSSQNSILSSYIKRTNCYQTNLLEIINTLRNVEDVKTQYKITGHYGSRHYDELLIYKNNKFGFMLLDDS